MTDKNSMLYWWDRVKYLPLPMPKTQIIEFCVDTLLEVIDGSKDSLIDVFKQVVSVANQFGYPLFMRTDLASAKHAWKTTCFVSSEKVLLGNMVRLIDSTVACDLLPMAIVLRKYIEMESSFTAFYKEMPVCKERRYFIKDGEVLCHHPYWVKDAIEGHKPSHLFWKSLLCELNHERPSEISYLNNLASIITKNVEGFWSIDFCCGKSGKWYFIDMAEGERSWHPKCLKVDKAKLNEQL